jgi:alpha-methylacyl-CoA racemase
MGPLEGLRVVEMTGLAPGPYCAMLLADLGADVLRVDRPGAGTGRSEAKFEVLRRNRRSIELDLKTPDDVATLLRLLRRADAFIEGFRPGVMERLGLGPDECLAANPRLVYGRITGWGQEGPLAHSAGHDVNYIALAGVLHNIATPGGPPVIPLNLVGDFAGGGLLLAFGIMCALFETAKSGKGQVIDAAMVDGAASLMSYLFGHRAQGLHQHLVPVRRDVRCRCGRRQ